MSESTLLRRIRSAELGRLLQAPVDSATLAEAQRIVDDVEQRGEVALREHAERLGDLEPGAPLWLDRERLHELAEQVPVEDRRLLERTRDRIEAFARAQRETMADCRRAVPGGYAGHRWLPVRAAGCYAPGGRFPLPSSVLMTVVPARVAGVPRVCVASPRPAPITLAAAAIAGADGFLCAGGAQSIAAMAYGVGPLPSTDMIVGPGNRWVTAAKQVVSAFTGIDMLAGPSELLVLADRSADADMIAADLLAQAEHDTDARPMLVSLDAPLIEAVEVALQRRLEELPTRDTAREALANGFALHASTLEEAIEACRRIAPEHLEVLTDNAGPVARELDTAGALFVGARSAEVLGDYGAGPNHVLPTGGSGRFRSGLSVADFMKPQTWLELNEGGDSADLVEDAVALARLEGLEGHARSAELRRQGAVRRR
ncbi:hypothetical protein ABI59_15630 [Acidobacteria bacterium Mor1]|nr:hypothetical protein ABI59_15630 [Acidobacteria bacterium Mor1]